MFQLLTASRSTCTSKVPMALLMIAVASSSVNSSTFASPMGTSIAQLRPISSKLMNTPRTSGPPIQ